MTDWCGVGDSIAMSTAFAGAVYIVKTYVTIYAWLELRERKPRALAGSNHWRELAEFMS